MPTLLLRLAGPLQSWGTVSKFENRLTEHTPTKSGVVGLLASALGRSRQDSVDDLAKMKFGVRVLQPGRVLRDFHTAHSKKSSYITTRYYLSDAKFVAGFESDDIEFLRTLESAVKNPAYPLFLGRRSCPPELPMFLGISDCSLEEALSSPFGEVDGSDGPNQNLIYVETAFSGMQNLLKDNPISFNPEKRSYGYRSVAEIHAAQNNGGKSEGEQPVNSVCAANSLDHDPFKDLD